MTRAIEVLLRAGEATAKLGVWLCARSRRGVGKLIEWAIPSFFLAILVGLILQHANDAAMIRNESLKLANRAAYAARPIWDAQVEWSNRRRVDVQEEMNSLHFDLRGRLPMELWVCAGTLMEIVKLGAAETILDSDQWLENFQEHRTAFVMAIERWRIHESRWFWAPWGSDTTCVPS